jgi:hypothetical protein
VPLVVKKKQEEQKVMRPATTPEAREQQLVSLAVNLAEKQLRDGTAAPSVINHFLKIASTRETIEREMLEKQSKLIEAKAQSIAKDREAEDLAKAAIEAMKNYNSGSN